MERKEKIMNCQFCDKPAVTNVTPPLCEKHLDLAILVERLKELKQPVTADTVQDLLAKAQANNGQLAITPADVAALLPAFLEKRLPQPVVFAS